MHCSTVMHRIFGSADNGDGFSTVYRGYPLVRTASDYDANFAFLSGFPHAILLSQ